MRRADHPQMVETQGPTAPTVCPSSNGLVQSEVFRDGGSGSSGLEFRQLSTDVSIVAVVMVSRLILSRSRRIGSASAEVDVGRCQVL